MIGEAFAPSSVVPASNALRRPTLGVLPAKAGIQ